MPRYAAAAAMSKQGFLLGQNKACIYMYLPPTSTTLTMNLFIVNFITAAALLIKRAAFQMQRAFPLYYMAAGIKM